MDQGILGRRVERLLTALDNGQLSLNTGNVPVGDLVKLREANANEKLRKSLAEHMKGLAEADETNLNRIAAEIARALASLIAEHSNEAEKLWQEYKKKLVLSGGVILTSRVALSPCLAGLFGLTSGLAGLVGSVGPVAKDFVHYRLDRNTLSQSMLGILSDAKAKSGSFCSLVIPRRIEEPHRLAVGE